jgi:GNAT superfamily N-acetyltransferase
MHHIILPTKIDDMSMILNLFNQAIEYQKVNNYIGWKIIDTKFIEADIQRGLLYKVLSEDKILGIFCVCFTDQLIWREREKGDAIYLHRIVLNREYQGLKIFRAVLHWAIDKARRGNSKYVRMDTWAANSKLIDYYKGYGFRLVENYTTENTTDLPVQHRNLNVALLEFEVS